MGCCLVVGGGVSFIDKLLTKCLQRILSRVECKNGVGVAEFGRFVTVIQVLQDLRSSIVQME